MQIEAIVHEQLEILDHAPWFTVKKEKFVYSPEILLSSVHVITAWNVKNLITYRVIILLRVNSTQRIKLI